MQSSNIDFEIIVFINGNEENIEVSEPLRDTEFSTTIQQIKIFIIDYIKSTHQITAKYENIKIDVVRNSRKIRYRNDDFEIEDEDKLYVELVEVITSSMQIPSKMETGFESETEKRESIPLSLQDIIQQMSLLNISLSMLTGNDPYYGYEGDRVDNIPNGYGVWNIEKQNEIREGFFVNGKLHGQGKKTHLNKDGEIEIINEGEWDMGSLNGSGKIFEAGAFSYEGEIVLDSMEGFGKLIDDEHDCIYEGNFERDNYQGSGKMIYGNGDVYEGNWRQGFFYGYGIMKYANGDVYSGEWFKEEPNEDVNDSGEYYARYYNERSVKHGIGKMIYSDGKIVEGVWNNDIMS